MRTFAVALLAAVATFLAGAGFGAQRSPELPRCPQEDSCAVDYRDGRWFIDGVVVSR